MNKKEFLALATASGLKVKWGDRVLLMNFSKGSSCHWIGLSSYLNWTDEKSDMIEKPVCVLRSLSMLTEPCLEGGRIPIDELRKYRPRL